MQLSFLSILGIFLLVFLLRFFYKYGLVPYLKLSKKIQEIKDKYSFFSYPFKPYGLSYITQFIKDYRQYGDSFHIRKHDFAKVDMTIGTIREHLNINLANEKLIHEFFEKQKEGLYIKTNSGVNFRSLKQFLGDGLLFSEGDQWKYKRKIMSGIFNYELIKSKFGMMTEIVNQVVSKAKIRNKGQNGKYQIDINKLFQQIFGNIVIRCFFGNIDLGEIDGKDVFEFLFELTNRIGERNVKISNFLLGPLITYGIRSIDREINRNIDLFRKFTNKTILKIIDHVKTNKLISEDEGLIAKLVREDKLVDDCSYDQKIKKGLYNHFDLINEMCTFFFAGTDTTANLASSIIHRLAGHKDIEFKLRQQIKQVLKDDLSNVTIESLKKMNYLRYVISQMLRFTPPVPFLIMREAIQDHTIGGIRIEKGTYVSAEIISRHYKQEDFDNPLEFRPERWQKIENASNISNIYIPFSYGPRVCIGQQLALTESKIAIITFLLNFKNGQETKPARVLYNITYGPERAIMNFEEN